MSEAECSNSSAGKDRTSTEGLTKSGSAGSKVKLHASKRGSHGRSHHKKSCKRSDVIAPKEIRRIEAFTASSKESSRSSGSASSKSQGSTERASTIAAAGVARADEAAAVERPPDIPTAATPRLAPSVEATHAKKELSGADSLAKSADESLVKHTAKPVAMPPAELPPKSPVLPVATLPAIAPAMPASKSSVKAALHPEAATKDKAMAIAAGQLHVDFDSQATTTRTETAVLSGHATGLPKTLNHTGASVEPLMYDDVFMDGAEGKTFAKSSLLPTPPFQRPLMFFLTMCNLMCTKHGDERPVFGDCNKAVSNFPAFADAFSCHKNARMSASKNCLYF